MPMAPTAGTWTLERLDALPEDGRRHELVHGTLFMTPAPGVGHERIVVRLARLLTPYVDRHRLGDVLHRGVVRFQGSQVEPDLMVCRLDGAAHDWSEVPPPSLVIEVTSPATRQRDRLEKRQFYLERGIATYWIVDGEARSVTVVTRGAADHVARDTIRWQPEGVEAPLIAELGGVLT